MRAERLSELDAALGAAGNIPGLRVGISVLGLEGELTGYGAGYGAGVGEDLDECCEVIMPTVP